MRCEGRDLIHPVGLLPNGCAVGQRHRPNHSSETVLVCPTEEGRPIPPGIEVATFKNLGDGSCEIVDSYVHGVARSGPAQVATEEFRRGWERTFGCIGVEKPS